MILCQSYNHILKLHKVQKDTIWNVIHLLSEDRSFHYKCIAAFIVSMPFNIVVINFIKCEPTHESRSTECYFLNVCTNIFYTCARVV